jgi:small subunit ribosomal protein S8
MAASDPVADMLTIIRNAIGVQKNVVKVPLSKLKEQLANVLKDANFIDDVSVDDSGRFPLLVLTLHSDEQNARITGLARMSKPGRRLYAKSTEIPHIMSGRGLVIVSTSHGLMSDRQARKKNVGGELVCKVY